MSLRLEESGQIWISTGHYHGRPKAGQQYLEIGDKEVDMTEAVEALQEALVNPILEQDTAIDGLKRYVATMLPTEKETRGYTDTWFKPHPSAPFPDLSQEGPEPRVEILGYELAKPDFIWLIDYVMTNTPVSSTGSDPRTTLIDQCR